MDDVIASRTKPRALDSIRLRGRRDERARGGNVDATRDERGVIVVDLFARDTSGLTLRFVGRRDADRPPNKP
jgi:hypothetical protein